MTTLFGEMKTAFDRIVLLLNGAALSLCGLALVDFLLHPLAADFTYHSVLYRAISMLVLTPLTLLVGFLIVRRVPGNVVGPLLILWSGTVAYGAVRKEIGLVPFALFAFYEIAVGWFALFLIVLHYPNGKIYPPRAAAWVYPPLGVSVLLNVLIFFSHRSLQAQMPNPFYLPALQKLSGPLFWSSVLLLSPALVLNVVSPALRYRKGSHLERQQIKWLALFGGFLVAGGILGFIAYPLATGGQVMSRENSLFSVIFFTVAGLFPPLAIGVAVLRYRLWDIDIIIRRTLVYSILTLILTLVYFGSVAVLQKVFALISGEQSPVAIVLSTLAIAALFAPLRRTIMQRIDRRFYRPKYDAGKVLAAFSATLRDEVDLDRLTNSILGVVQEITQPAHVSLWMGEGDHQPEQQPLDVNAPRILRHRLPREGR
jgi:hypothetical protein